jgi:hypothetical protein
MKGKGVKGRGCRLLISLGYCNLQLVSIENQLWLCFSKSIQSTTPWGCS